MLLLAALSGFPTEATRAKAETNALVVILGAAGEPDYFTNFLTQAQTWHETAQKAGWTVATIGEAPAQTPTDLDRIRNLLETEPKTGAGQLWIVLIGHGTFDDKVAKFNLNGPDLSATELANWLKPFSRPLTIINTSSSSSPFLNQLSGTNRVVITATRSGHERNYTRFGGYFAQAITRPESDLDKDEQVSLLEAFIVASRQVGEFYKVEGRIATEHALLDDNADGLGTPADWFRGVRAVKKPVESRALDGLPAHQRHLLTSPAEKSLTPELRARRDGLEKRIFEHRERKASMNEAAYYAQLEKLLLEMAEIYSGQ
jgi:hypothetical protein